MMSLENVAKSLCEYLQYNPDGLTMPLHRNRDPLRPYSLGETPRSGYAVSMPRELGLEWRVPVIELNWRPVRSWLAGALKWLAIPPYYIGVWRDEDWFVFDVSTVCEDRSSAMRTARDCEQQAVYDLAKHRVIEVGV